MNRHTTQRTLITGGAGFIGSHLACRLDEGGHDVTVVDDLSNGHSEWLPDSVRFVEADLTQPAAVSDIVSPEYDLVFHLASRKAVDGPDPREQFRENTGMTYELIEQVLDADIPEFFYTPTSTVYGEAARPTPEDYAPLEPISAYGASKLADLGWEPSKAEHTSRSPCDPGTSRGSVDRRAFEEGDDYRRRSSRQTVTMDLAIAAPP